MNTIWRRPKITITATRAVDVELTSPLGCEDPRFEEEQVVYGAKEPQLDWSYNDLLQRRDPERYETAWQMAEGKEAAVTYSAQFFELFLSLYFDAPVEVRCVIAGIHRGTKAVYFVFGYKRKEEEHGTVVGGGGGGRGV